MIDAWLIQRILDRIEEDEQDDKQVIISREIK